MLHSHMTVYTYVHTLFFSPKREFDTLHFDWSHTVGMCSVNIFTVWSVSGSMYVRTYAYIEIHIIYTYRIIHDSFVNQYASIEFFYLYSRRIICMCYNIILCFLIIRDGTTYVVVQECSYFFSLCL